MQCFAVRSGADYSDVACFVDLDVDAADMVYVRVGGRYRRRGAPVRGLAVGAPGVTGTPRAARALPQFMAMVSCV